MPTSSIAYFIEWLPTVGVSSHFASWGTLGSSGRDLNDGGGGMHCLFHWRRDH